MLSPMTQIADPLVDGPESEFGVAYEAHRAHDKTTAIQDLIRVLAPYATDEEYRFLYLVSRKPRPPAKVSANTKKGIIKKLKTNSWQTSIGQMRDTGFLEFHPLQGLQKVVVFAISPKAIQSF